MEEILLKTIEIRKIQIKMETRNILTEHSREVAEPGVQWVQQYSPIILGIEVKPVKGQLISKGKVKVFN